jgi:hypothetical protein
MEDAQRKRGNYLSIGKRSISPHNTQALTYPWLDGGTSGLPALYIIDEMSSRLQFDLKLDIEIQPYRRFDIIIGTGTGG